MGLLKRWRGRWLRGVMLRYLAELERGGVADPLGQRLLLADVLFLAGPVRLTEADAYLGAPMVLRLPRAQLKGPPAE